MYYISMKLPMSERNSYILMTFVGLLLGISVYVAYLNRDGISEWFSSLMNPTQQEENEELDYPYFAPGNRDQYIGQDLEWYFELFQPKIVRYETEGDLNFAVVKYVPDVNLQDASGVDVEYEVKVLLSSEGQLKDGDPEEVPVTGEEDLHRLLSNRIRYFKTFDWNVTEEQEGQDLINMEEFKKRFPVGSRVAMRVLAQYPGKDMRTDGYCSEEFMQTVWVCKYLDWYPQFTDEMKAFFEGDEVSEEFTLIVYSVSDELSTREVVLR